MRAPFWRRIAALIRRGRLDDELRQELEFHLEQRSAEYARQGLPRNEARAAALRRLGDPHRIREQARDVWEFPTVESFLQDVRFALRSLRRQPRFAAAAVFILALGIGANTAVFSVLNATLLGWLDTFAESERLVMVWQQGPTGLWTPTPGDFRDWRDRNTVFERIGAWQFETQTLQHPHGEPERLSVARVTADFFRMLAVPPARGRDFADEEERWENHRAMMISHRLWTSRFHRDPAAVGARVSLDGEPYTVIGVAPPGAWIGWSRPDVWTPFSFAPDDENGTTRNSHNTFVVARLRAGVTIDAARREMRALAGQLEEEYPENKGLSADVRPLREMLLRRVEPMLRVLMAAVGCVLLIACANVANLLLVRGAARQRELAIRAALGAGRRRIVRQLVTEGIVLAAAGASAGLALAYWALAAATPWLPDTLPRLHETGLRLDGRVLAFTAVVALAAALIFSLAPALRSTTGRLDAPLRETAWQASGTRRQRSMQRTLATIEVAIAVVLLVGSILTARSLANLQAADLGIRDARGVVTMRLALPPAEAAEGYGSTRAFYEAVLQDVRALPGVIAAGVTSHVPLDGGGQSKYFWVADQEPPATLDAVPVVSTRQESPGSLEALGVRLLQGRFFNERDTTESPRVAIIERTLAAKFFGAANPLGRYVWLDPPENLIPDSYRTTLGGAPERWQVVGVIDDVRYEAPDALPESVIHVPYLQRSKRAGMGWAPEFLVIRTSIDPAPLVGAVRAAVRRIRPEQAIGDIRTIDELVARSHRQPFFTMALLGTFAAIATALALLGVHSVISCAAGQRTREIAVRLALGATRRDILALVARDVAFIASAGVVIGAGGAVWFTRFMRGTLYGIEPTDPMTVTMAALALAAVALVAGVMPARRAAAVAPSVALRCD